MSNIPYRAGSDVDSLMWKLHKQDRETILQVSEKMSKPTSAGASYRWIGCNEEVKDIR